LVADHGDLRLVFAIGQPFNYWYLDLILSDGAGEVIFSSLTVYDDL